MFRFRWPSRKFLKRCAIALVASALILLAVDEWIISPMLGRKLTALVAQHLNARLVIGSISYRPPFGLVASHCVLIFDNPDHSTQELANVDEIRLKLAELPIHGRPLLIQELTLENPAIHIIRTADGIEGSHDLIKPQPVPAGEAPPPSKKFSDVLQLRHFQIDNGSVTFVDRAGADQSASESTWSGINIKINLSQNDPADYAFLFNADNSLAMIEAAGAFNVDQGAAQLKQFTLTTQAAPANPPRQIPVELQRLMQRYAVKGQLKIEGSAAASAKNAAGDSASIEITLQNGSMLLPKSQSAGASTAPAQALFGIPLTDVNLSAKISADPASVTTSISHFTASAAGGKISMNDGAALTIDRATGQWSATKFDGSMEFADGAPSISQLDFQKDWRPLGQLDFTGTGSGPFGPRAHWADSTYEILVYPRKFSVQPPACPLAITSIEGGPIRITPDVLAAKGLTAIYGGDSLKLTNARLAIPPLGQHSMRWTEINASAVMNNASAAYPPLLKQIFDEAHPSGEYFLAGHVTIDPFDRRHPHIDYDLLISSDHASLQIARVNTTLIQLKADAELFPDHFQINKMQCQGLGGAISGNGTISTVGPNAFSGTIFADHLSLAQVRKLDPLEKAPDKPVSGQTSIQATFSGSNAIGWQTAANLFQAQGQIEIYNGQFWDLPVLSGIARRINASPDDSIISQGAALFRVSQEQVQLQNAAVNAPILGLAGSGVIGFDGKIDLDLVAAPLADWRDRAKKTGVPIISNLAGDILGNLQKVVNTATGTLLYEFHVTGTTSDPNIVTIPAPILTQTAAGIFNNMLNQNSQSRPIEVFGQLSPPPPPTPK